jgi:murein DD-endopeptidase MepM/ murein hydrolase activator NlpD
VASRPEAPSFRHVGRVVDPMVREDGEPEPEVVLDGPQSAGPEGGDTPPEAPPPGGPERGARMRERLLERAERARQSPVLDAEPSTSGDDLDEIGRLPRGRDELTRRAPGAPIVTKRSALSPTVVALFGTLMGMAVIASITAVAMQLSPQRKDASPVASASTAPEKTAVPAKPEEKPVPKRARTKVPGPFRIADKKGDPAFSILTGKVSTNPFLRAVKDSGVPMNEAYRLPIAFKGTRDFDKCAKTDTFVTLLDRNTKRIKAFEYIVSPEEVYQATEGADGLLKATKLDLKVERHEIAGAMVYDGKDFDGSAERAGFERGLAKAVEKAINGHATLSELERGDRLRLIVQEITVLGEFARYAGVEALEIRRVTGDVLRLYYFDSPGERGHYDAKGRAPYEGGWRKPIPGAPITSRFNLKRLHPVLKKVMPHLGTDFGAPTGTPIGASAPGTVTFIGYAGPAGNLVKVAHAGGIETGYAHLSRFAEGLKVGDKVGRLELVGYVGSTGRSTGPHLHFSATKNKEYFDAETLKLDGLRTIGSEQRATFAALMTKYDALLEAIPLPAELPKEAAPTAPEDKPGDMDLVATDESEADSDLPGSAAPAAAPLKQPAAAPATAPATTSDIYLSDKELMELQR